MPERGQAAKDLPQQTLFRRPSRLVIYAFSAVISLTSSITGIVIALSPSHHTSRVPSAYQLCIVQAQTAPDDPVLSNNGFGADPVPQDSVPGSDALNAAERANAVSSAEDLCAREHALALT